MNIILDDSTVINVTNRDNGTVGYMIPEMNGLVRQFQPRETKKLTMGELRKLSYIPGGDALLKDYFILDNKQAIQELVPGAEPEYYYTDKEIIALLQTGSLAQLMDCLDFAPEGVIDLVKDLAVKLPLNDVAKREAIYNKTGFNVTKAIEINKETVETSSEVAQVQASKGRRRAAAITEEKHIIEEPDNFDKIIEKAKPKYKVD